MKILKTVFIGVCFLSSSFVNAEIPVVDLNDSQTHTDHPLVNNYGLSKSLRQKV